MKAQLRFVTIVGPLIVGIGYYAIAALSLYITHGGEGIAMIWPPSGILFAALLLAPRRIAPFYGVAAAVASLAANLSFGSAWPIAGGFTLANVTEAALAAYIVRRASGYRLSFVNPAGLKRFCLAALIGAALGAMIGTAVSPHPSGVFYLSWFTTDLLAMLIVAPLILICAELRGSATIDARVPLREVAAVLAMVMGLTAATFGQSSLPLLFLPMIALLLAVLRLGTLGAASSVFIIAIGSSLAASFDRGPVHLIHAGKPAEVLFLQFYLLALFASALPMAVLLTARARLTASLTESNRLLKLAEGLAHVGHWRVDFATGALFWSDQVFRIHGMKIDVQPCLTEAIEYYHPEDRALVMEALDSARANKSFFGFPARIIRPDGTIRHIASRGEMIFGTDGDAISVFGVVQDVTAHVEAALALEEARRAAEIAAQEATVRAETDELTGIASRRKLFRKLDDAIVDAAASGARLAIVIFDIDHFKRINDTFGHVTGDGVLCRITRAAGSVLRSGDLLGRVGGEEFVFLLPGADAMRATIVAERVRLAILASNAPGEPSVSASFGVAAWVAGESNSALVQRADHALYAAKAAGRNTSRQAA